MKTVKLAMVIGSKLWARYVSVVVLFLGVLLVALLLQRSSGNAAPASLYWAEPQALSQAGSDASYPLLRVAPDGNRFLVAYNWETGNKRNPYFVESTDGGQSWTAPAPIRASNFNLQQVTIAFDQNNIAHAVWKSDSGLSHADESQWGSTGTIHSVIDTVDKLQEPSLAIGSDGVLHLVWAQGDPDTLPHNIYYSYSKTYGASWEPPVPLANHVQHSSVPSVAVGANNNVHVVWEENVTSPTFGYRVFYKAAQKTGTGYEWDNQHTVLSGNLTNVHRPAIIADSTAVHVSFSEQENQNADTQYPYYVKIPVGETPSAPLDASNGNHKSVNIAPLFLITTLASCNNGTHLFYHGAATENAREQIWGASSASNWTSVDAATTDEHRDVYPWLVCVNNALHLVFERIESGTGDHRIYYTANRNIFRAHLPVMFRP